MDNKTVEINIPFTGKVTVKPTVRMIEEMGTQYELCVIERAKLTLVLSRRFKWVSSMGWALIGTNAVGAELVFSEKDVSPDILRVLNDAMRHGYMISVRSDDSNRLYYVAETKREPNTLTTPSRVVSLLPAA